LKFANETKNNPRVGISFIGRTKEEYNYSNRNSVEKCIKSSLLSAGLGGKNPDIPFADIISPHMSVFIKPNLLLHYNMGSGGTDCLYTNREVIRAVVKEIVSSKPKKIILGDASFPITDWKKIMPETFQDELKKIASSIPLEIIDLRKQVVLKEDLASGFRDNLRDKTNYVLFNLKDKSFLEPITKKGQSSELLTMIRKY
jgi:uncharacterized protein (DUF362 family)